MCATLRCCAWAARAAHATCHQRNGSTATFALASAQMPLLRLALSAPAPHPHAFHPCRESKLPDVRRGLLRIALHVLQHHGDTITRGWVPMLRLLEAVPQRNGQDAAEVGLGFQVGTARVEVASGQDALVLVNRPGFSTRRCCTCVNLSVQGLEARLLSRCPSFCMLLTYRPVYRLRAGGGVACHRLPGVIPAQGARAQGAGRHRTLRNTGGLARESAARRLGP